MMRALRMHIEAERLDRLSVCMRRARHTFLRTRRRLLEYGMAILGGELNEVELKPNDER
jgi:hypothetical protein